MKRSRLVLGMALLVSVLGAVAPAGALTTTSASATVKVPTYSSLGRSMVAAGNDANQYWLYYGGYSVTVRVHGFALPSNVHWQLPRRARPSDGPAVRSGDLTVRGEAFFRSADEVRRIAAGMVRVSLPTFRAMAEQGDLFEGELRHLHSAGLPMPVTTDLRGGFSSQGVLYRMCFGSGVCVSTSVGTGEPESHFTDDCGRTSHGIVVGLFALGGTPLPSDLHVRVSSHGKTVAAGEMAIDRRGPGLAMFDALLPANATQFTVSWGGISETLGMQCLD